MKINSHSNFKVCTSSKNIFYSLYELLIQGSIYSLPILVTLNNKTYSSSNIPEKVLSSALQLNELENSDMKIINKLEIQTLKKNIKNGFETFFKNNNQSFYTNIYYIENTKNLIINSNKFLKKLYMFLNNSKKENLNPIIYINNFQITIKDYKKTLNEFKSHINNKLSNQNTSTNTINNFEINEDNIKTSLFKKIDILSNLLNSDFETNCLKNNLKPAIFKVINIA